MKRRDIFILILVWASAGLLVLIAGFLYLAQSQGRTTAVVDAPAPAPAPTLPNTFQVTFAENTALRLYPIAEAAARSWQADAQLVSAEATWSTTAIDQVGKPTPWSFRFYSVTAQRSYFVTILPDGQINARQHFLAEPNPPGLLPAQRWTVDSNQAIATWLNAGGGTFLGENPGLEVSATLSYQRAGDDVFWHVTGLNQKNQALVSTTVDAQSGAVVELVR